MENSIEKVLNFAYKNVYEPCKYYLLCVKDFDLEHGPKGFNNF